MGASSGTRLLQVILKAACSQQQLTFGLLGKNTPVRPGFIWLSTELCLGNHWTDWPRSKKQIKEWTGIDITACVIVDNTKEEMKRKFILAAVIGET